MDTLQAVAFGTLLRRHRLAAGLTQEELADRAGISRRSVGDMERGVVHTPHKDTVALLADALALSPQDRSAFAEAARRLGAPAPSVPISASTSAPPFVGRARELALLERHLAGAGPPVLLLAGEPGIGKTRLLHAAMPRAVPQGLRVLEGGCQRRGGQEPYAPLLGALQRHMRSRRPSQLRADLQGCAWLVRLLPELADGPVPPLPPWTLTSEQERRLTFEAVVRFLANVAGPAGTLLVLDDLQWAGSDALDLLATLARSAAEVPLRIVGAYRDTEVQPDDALSVMLADLAHAGLASRRQLGPLARAEAAQLLEGLLAGAADEERALRERVLQRAGGVPFFVVSCARAVQWADHEDGSRAEAVPWDVAQSVRQRAAVLPEGARELLGVAAVVGREVQLVLLKAVVGQAERGLLAALEAACRARLLVEAGEDAYQFAHDVIREVVEADLGTARHMVVHRRVAEVLEQHHGPLPVELLAYHYGRSDVQEKAIPYLEQAGDRARAQYANAAAETYYRELVDRLDGLGRAVDAARACEKLGAVLSSVGQYDAALAVLGSAAEAYQAAGHLEQLQHTLAQIAHTHSLGGTPEEGIARLEAFMERLEPSGETHGVAALNAARAELLQVTGRYREALMAAERVAEFARTGGDLKLLATAELRRGWALLLLGGRIKEAFCAAEEACRVAELAGDLEVLRFALELLATICTFWGKLDASLGYYDRELEVAERQGSPTQMAVAMVAHAKTDFWMGNWAQARRQLDGAMAMRPQIDAAWYFQWSLVYRGCLSLAEGTWQEATRLLEDCVAITARQGNLFLLRWSQSLLAECDLLQGRAEAARSRLIPLLDRLGLEELSVTRLLPVLAWAYLELGELAQAEHVVVQAIRRMRADNIRLDLPDALRVQAMVAIRQERWDEVERSLEEGLTLATSMVYPYAEARLLHVYGEMHTRKGEPEQARERLEAALAIFRRLGARKDADRTEQGIADLR